MVGLVTPRGRCGGDMREHLHCHWDKRTLDPILLVVCFGEYKYFFHYIQWFVSFDRFLYLPLNFDSCSHHRECDLFGWLGGSLILRSDRIRFHCCGLCSMHGLFIFYLSMDNGDRKICFPKTHFLFCLQNIIKFLGEFVTKWNWFLYSMTTWVLYFQNFFNIFFTPKIFSQKYKNKLGQAQPRLGLCFDWHWF